MFLLHVELKVNPEICQALENVYLKTFRPAISVQEGFCAVQLLHSTEEEMNYCLSLSFDSQASQKKWVASDLHQQVWPQIESRCVEFSVKYYTSV